MDDREAAAIRGAGGADSRHADDTASGIGEPETDAAGEPSPAVAHAADHEPDAHALTTPDAAAEPAEGGPGTFEAKPVPRRRRWPKTAAALGAAALIGGAVAAVLIGGGPSTLGGVAARLPTPGAQPERPPADGAWGRVGDPVSSGAFEFTVTGVHTGLDHVGGTVQGERAQGSFVVARVTVRNVGDKAGFFTDADQRLVDTQGARHRPDNTAGLRAGNPDALFGRLAPGTQVRGGLVFDVPPGTRPAALRLHDFTSDHKPAVVRLKG